MAADEVEICNLALLRVGSRNLITSLSDDTTEGRGCAVAYSLSRDAVLAGFAWRFAEAQATLAELTTTWSGFTYVYALPTDFVSARYIYSAANIGALAASSNRIPYEVVSSSTGRMLVTDQEDAILVYTAQVTTVPFFPPLFVQALAWKLATELCLFLPVKPQIGLAMDGKYQAALKEAAAFDMRQSHQPEGAASEFISERE